MNTRTPRSSPIRCAASTASLLLVALAIPAGAQNLDELVEILVETATSSLTQGETSQVVAMGRVADGTVYDITSEVSWASTNPAVASVAPGGKVRAVGPFTTTLVAMRSGVSGHAEISVAGSQSIAVFPSRAGLPLGRSLQLRAFGVDPDGSLTPELEKARWTSSNPKLASVDGSGLVEARAAGALTVSVSHAHRTGKVSLNVTPAVPTGITIRGSAASVEAGGSVQFVADGTFSDGLVRDLTSQVSWASSNPGVARISASGLATGVAPTSTTITATLDALSGAERLTVADD